MNSIILKYIIYSAGFMAFEKIIKNNSNNRNKKTSYLNIPNFKGVLEVRHYLPGRLRLYVPLLKNNLELTELFKNQLKKIDSIEIKNINTTTGTILLNFKEKDMKPVLVIGIIIKLLGLEDKIGKKNKSLVKKEIDNLKDSVNLAVYDKTNGIFDFKSILTLVLIAAGITTYIKRPESLPNGINYLWWAYSNTK